MVVVAVVVVVVVVFTRNLPTAAQMERGLAESPKKRERNQGREGRKAVKEITEEGRNEGRKEGERAGIME